MVPQKTLGSANALEDSQKLADFMRLIAKGAANEVAGDFRNYLDGEFFRAGFPCAEAEPYFVR